MLKPFVDMTELHVDDRGTVYCPFDNNGDGDVGEIKRTYVVHNWEKGRIRAWHYHENGWTGLHVIHGAAVLVAKKHKNSTDIIRHILSDKNPGIFWVPPGYANGNMSLVDDTRILVYSTLTFEEAKNDNIRWPISEGERFMWFSVKDR